MEMLLHLYVRNFLKNQNKQIKKMCGIFGVITKAESNYDDRFFKKLINRQLAKLSLKLEVKILQVYAV